MLNLQIGLLFFDVIGMDFLITSTNEKTIRNKVTLRNMMEFFAPTENEDQGR